MKKVYVLHSHLFFFVLVICSLFSALPSLAQGNLLIMPRRVVFENAKRTQELNLANTGKDTARYEISVIQYRMKEDGNFEPLAETDTSQNFATKYFRFFPRSVVLAPNEAQVVKLQLTNTSNLKPGEYRSHLYFRSVPKFKPLGEKDTVAGASSISVKLVAVFGLAIPVIIRNGETKVSASISDVSLQTADHNNILKMQIHRSGNMSVYGDLKVNYISAKGTSTQVGLVNGLSVYTPNPVRHFQIILNSTADIDYHKGKLQVVYMAQADAKPLVFAETELVLR